MELIIHNSNFFQLNSLKLACKSRVIRDGCYRLLSQVFIIFAFYWSHTSSKYFRTLHKLLLSLLFYTTTISHGKLSHREKEYSVKFGREQVKINSY